MHSPRAMILTLTTLLLPFALVGTARADEFVTADLPLALVVPTRVEADTAVDPVAADTAFGATVAVDRLGALRGGTDTVTQNVGLHGNVDGNSANGTVSGTNLVQGGSFGNAAGISTVIQNSGNNVLIQNSTTVSVQFAPNP